MKQACPICMAYLLDHPNLLRWKKCPTCGFCRKDKGMNLTLTRREYREDGIFSELTDENGNIVAKTLEHAYDDGNGGWAPKIPAGTFTCVRGPHRLNGMSQDFETFEITGVQGHVNLLFHWGNWNKDSEGCILLGGGIAQSSQGQMVTNSRSEFQSFMNMESGVDQFTLTVIA